jgi:hypothetical protein
VPPTPDRPPDAPTPATPGGPPPLLHRAASGDREAFARLYDQQVEEVYRYLLAWTGDHGGRRH